MDERRLHAQRGQTIPVWTFGVLTSLMLMTMIFNYATSLRWQIRAQNASDSVAQAILSVQTQHYNQVTAQLHAAAIEEWRIRRTLAALVYVMQGSGGCTDQNATLGSPAVSGTSGWIDCAAAYNSLRNNYVAEVARYTADVQNMAALSNYTQTQQLADMQTIANSFETNCASSGATGADCAFTYTIANPTSRPSLSGAQSDSGGENNGDGEALPAGGLVSDLNPLEIEVVACAEIAMPFSSFFHLNAAPFYAIGRSASTSTMVTQEWFAPGVLNNPNSPTNAYFQPPEFVESSTNSQPSIYNATNFCTSRNSAYDWYAVHYCSNSYLSAYTTPAPGVTPGYGGYSTTITSDEFSTWTGWWAAVPIPPYNGGWTPTTSTCNAQPWNHP
ncbi:MAG: hypothetical protein JO199_13440 [Candidatus Eremiobacteraeota bacterium]|nr:hypothetical protein [Candidatus Eremiobacteraeota bacterium]